MHGLRRQWLHAGMVIGLAALCACGHDWNAADGGTDDAEPAEIDSAADVPGEDTDLPDETSADADADVAADADADVPDEGEPYDAADLSDVAEAEAEDGTIDVGPGCGDGVVQTGEECDDGNTTAGDGCNPDCRYSCHLSTDCPDDGNVCTAESCAAGGSGQLCRTEPVFARCDDGDPCTSGDTCTDGVCRGTVSLNTFYRDADSDGYGTSADTVCGWSAPAGYVPASGDCCDARADVNPGQMAFFQTTYSCTSSSVPSWDFDCDGALEPEFPNCASCADGVGGCVTTPGWESVGPVCAVPTCGAGGVLITTCGPLCRPGPATDSVQRCN
jgi:cysteine-rich repeat protein